MNPVEAWNQISWAEAIPFLLVLAGLYWSKKWIDLKFAKKQSQIVYKVKIVEGHIDIDHAHIDDIGEMHGDVITHPKQF